MDETIEIKVTSEMAGKRLDVVLSEQCSDLTRSYINKLCKEERAALNGKTSKGNKKCKEGDVITLQVPEPTELEILPEEMNLDIVYEDQDVILINKPKGMVVHPAAGHYSGTLVNGLMAHCKDDLSGINGVLRPGIVHRIDKDTTGILIVCKNDMAHQSIAKQLYDHSITRKYHAIVYGNIKEEIIKIIFIFRMKFPRHFHFSFIVSPYFCHNSPIYWYHRKTNEAGKKKRAQVLPDSPNNNLQAGDGRSST